MKPFAKFLAKKKLGTRYRLILQQPSMDRTTEQQTLFPIKMVPANKWNKEGYTKTNYCVFFSKMLMDGERRGQKERRYLSLLVTTILDFKIAPTSNLL